MKIAEHIEALDITMNIAGRQSAIHPVLLWGGEEGLTLIDTGMPGQLELIKAHLDRLGLALADIRRIILTHQDIDHIGGAAALVEASGAEVYAHADDVPFIEGVKPLIKMTDDRVERMTQSLPEEERERVRRILTNPPSVNVNRRLHDGEELDLHGGMLVVHTPGHTPGHLSIFLREPALLVAGDALRVEDGQLVGPSPAATPDMARAVASLGKLVPLPVRQVLCYHGGLAADEVAGRIRELAAET
ncbi:MBL fold metallo-hydrolase [Salinispira pacifica]